MELEKAYFTRNWANERLFIQSAMSLVLYFQNRYLSYLKMSIVRSKKFGTKFKETVYFMPKTYVLNY